MTLEKNRAGGICDWKSLEDFFMGQLRVALSVWLLEIVHRKQNLWHPGSRLLKIRVLELEKLWRPIYCSTTYALLWQLVEEENHSNKKVDYRNLLCLVALAPIFFHKTQSLCCKYNILNTEFFFEFEVLEGKSKVLLAVKPNEKKVAKLEIPFIER